MNPDPLTKLSRRHGTPLIIVILLFVGLILIGFGEGIVAAQKEKTFMLKTGQIHDDGK